MSPALAASRVAEIRSVIHDDRRVSLTDFSRGRAWRDKLAANGILELQDRSERIAWVVSEQDMTQIVDYIAELEEQMERDSAEAMVRTREGREDWKGGPELAEAALKSFEQRKDALMAAVER